MLVRHMLSSCVCVCLSVCHTPSGCIETAACIELIFYKEASPDLYYPELCYKRLVYISPTRKLSLTDRISNWDPNLDLWPSIPGELWSGPIVLHLQRSRSKVTRFKSYSGNRRTDIQTEAIALALVLTRWVKIKIVPSGNRRRKIWYNKNVRNTVGLTTNALNAGLKIISSHAECIIRELQCFINSDMKKTHRNAGQFDNITSTQQQNNKQSVDTCLHKRLIMLRKKTQQKKITFIHWLHLIFHFLISRTYKHFQ